MGLNLLGENLNLSVLCLIISVFDAYTCPKDKTEDGPIFHKKSNNTKRDNKWDGLIKEHFGNKIKDCLEEMKSEENKKNLVLLGLDNCKFGNKSDVNDDSKKILSDIILQCQNNATKMDSDFWMEGCSNISQYFKNNFSVRIIYNNCVYYIIPIDVNLASSQLKELYDGNIEDASMSNDVCMYTSNKQSGLYYLGFSASDINKYLDKGFLYSEIMDSLYKKILEYIHKLVFTDFKGLSGNERICKIYEDNCKNIDKKDLVNVITISESAKVCIKYGNEVKPKIKVFNITKLVYRT